MQRSYSLLPVINDVSGNVAEMERETEQKPARIGGGRLESWRFKQEHPLGRVLEPPFLFSNIAMTRIEEE